MDSEEFQLILNMVGQAGEGAFVLAVLYMGVGFLKSAFVPAAFVCIALLATRSIPDFIKSCRYTSKRAELDWHKETYPYGSGHIERMDIEEEMKKAAGK
jgi:hypothetical protein